MAYGQELAGTAPKAQSAIESMLGEANSLQTMANDLFNRLDAMDTRVHGNRPTPIAGAQLGKPTTTSQGFRADLNETLSVVHQLLTDCHTKMESLEGFV